MPPSFARRRTASLAAVGVCLGWIVVLAAGCTSPAQRDVYAQKMSSEIRVLEDQLYDADYQNRVLRDRLEQCRLEKACDPADVEMSPHLSSPSTIGDRPPIVSPGNPDEFAPPASNGSAPFDDFVPQEPQRTDSRRGTDSQGTDLPTDRNQPETLDTDEWGVIEIDPGEPMGDDSAPSPLADPETRPQRGLPSASPEEIPAPPADPPGVGMPGDGMTLPPAPTEPQPPGKRSLRAPDLIPGELVPPPSDPELDPLPPGQIPLPDSIRDQSPIEIQIHPTFSGGAADEDGEVPQITVVVHALDQDGKTVDLDHFDVQANMSVIVMDPELPVGKDKIGRWDFTPTQTATMVRSQPVSGLHVPIRWGQDRPLGREVIVHARLESEGESLRCHGRVTLDRPRQVASLWTPRSAIESTSKGAADSRSPKDGKDDAIGGPNRP